MNFEKSNFESKSKFEKFESEYEILENISKIEQEIEKYKKEIENLELEISELKAQDGFNNSIKIEEKQKEISGIKDKILILEEKERLEKEKIKK
ncbi:MAG: hypothetical protein ACPL3E_01750 [Minisyncoccia bacterium]